MWLQFWIRAYIINTMLALGTGHLLWRVGEDERGGVKLLLGLGHVLRTAPLPFYVTFYVTCDQSLNMLNNVQIYNFYI